MNVRLFKMIFWLILFFQGFHVAAQGPDLQDFLSKYYVSSQRNDKGYSKLLYAVEMGYRDVAFKLLNHGEDPNYLPKNQKSPTPFILAIHNEDEELVKLMIEKGANVNLKAYFPSGNSQLVSPLYVSSSIIKTNEVTQILCDYGAKVIETDFWIWTWYNPLDITMKNADADKFFIIANTLSDTEIRKIDAGRLNLLAVPMGFPTSRQYKENTVKIAKYLVRRGLELEINGFSALATSIIHGNNDLFYFILSCGVDINYNFGGPLFSAIGYQSTREAFIKNYPECESFIAAKFEFLDALFELGVNLNFSKPMGYSPLGYAVECELFEVVSYLLSHGADVNMLDATKKTSLIRAVDKNNWEIVNLLLSCGADPTQAGGNGQTPIDIAYAKGYSKILTALINAEAHLLD